MPNYLVLDKEGRQNMIDDIAGKLAFLRKQEGLTQRQAAKLAKSAPGRISDLENGRADMYVGTLQRWANVYGYNVEVHFVPIEEEKIVRRYSDSKRHEVEAIQLTGNNVELVKTWCNGRSVLEHDALDHEKTFEALNVDGEEGSLRASQGDYVVKDGYWFKVIGPGEFENTYRAVN